MITQADLDAAKADIVDKTNARFAALSKLVAPEPPVPATPIRFAAHRYYGSGPIAAEASYFDLQHSQWLDQSKFPAGSEKYRYVTTARSLDDLSGDRQFLPPRITAASALLLHDSLGNSVSRVANHDDLLNIGSPTLVSLIVNNIPTLVKGYDGLYLDEVDPTWKFGYPNYASIREMVSEDAWRAAMLTLVQALRAGLDKLGKKLWVNLGGPTTDTPEAWRNSIISKVHGVNTEFFVGRSAAGQSTALGADWDLQVRFGQDVEAGYRKQWHAHCSSSLQGVVDFAFVSWVLATERLGSFSASPDYAGGVLLPSKEVRAFVDALGAPTGGYVEVANGARYRDFEKGRLAVNPQLSTAWGIPSMSWVFS